MLYQIHLRPAATMLLMAILSGCAQPPVAGTQGAATGPAPMAAPSNDPVIGFLASAEPGAAAELPGLGMVRQGRSYTAASGRECREVMLGRGAEERGRLYCRGEGQGWTMARALIRGGTTRQ